MGLSWSRVSCQTNKTDYSPLRLRDRDEIKLGILSPFMLLPNIARALWRLILIPSAVKNLTTRTEWMTFPFPQECHRVPNFQNRIISEDLTRCSVTTVGCFVSQSVRGRHRLKNKKIDFYLSIGITIIRLICN